MTEYIDRLPTKREPIDALVRPFQRFASLQASSGLVLVAVTVAALVWANSPWSGGYDKLWSTQFTIGTGPVGLTKSFLFWINDGLMTVFFLVVGLEIKRELLVGELASPRRAALPLVAALGGMAMPAVIYLAFNGGGESARGWAIPVATDIAFALGVLALLGDRVPIAIKAFLTALAIADDIGGILVIAVFFTNNIAALSLLGAAGAFTGLLVAGRLGVRSQLVYAGLGFALWFALLESGIHATLAGVLIAIAVPARTKIDSRTFVSAGRALLDHFEHAGAPGESVLSNPEQQDAVQSLKQACGQAETPLQRMEHQLHPWVVFAIMPLFALSNAGVHLGGDFVGSMAEPVTVGVMLGLLLGKPLGITLAVWLAIVTRVASLPSGMSFKQLHGVAWLAGIGFTLSMFIAELALSDEGHLEHAKVGILAGSLLAAVAGSAVLILVTPGGRESTSTRTRSSKL